MGTKNTWTLLRIMYAGYQQELEKLTQTLKKVGKNTELSMSIKLRISRVLAKGQRVLVLLDTAEISTDAVQFDSVSIKDTVTQQITELQQLLDSYAKGTTKYNMGSIINVLDVKTMDTGIDVECESVNVKREDIYIRSPMHEYLKRRLPAYFILGVCACLIVSGVDIGKIVMNFLGRIAGIDTASMSTENGASLIDYLKAAQLGTATVQEQAMLFCCKLIGIFTSIACTLSILMYSIVSAVDLLVLSVPMLHEHLKGMEKFISMDCRYALNKMDDDVGMALIAETYVKYCNRVGKLLIKEYPNTAIAAAVTTALVYRGSIEYAGYILAVASDIETLKSEYSSEVLSEYLALG